MSTASKRPDAVSVQRRASMLLMAGGLVAPAVASAGDGAVGSQALQLARSLGLVGMGARELIDRVQAAVGADRLEVARTELLRRIASSGCALGEAADLVRMWAREDFVHGRTTVVGGLHFADTEAAVFALIDHG